MRLLVPPGGLLPSGWRLRGGPPHHQRVAGRVTGWWLRVWQKQAASVFSVTLSEGRRPSPVLHLRTLHISEGLQLSNGWADNDLLSRRQQRMRTK